MKRHLFLIAVITALGFQAVAQRPARMDSQLNRWSFGLTTGVTTHFGTIKQNDFWPDRDEIGIAYGLKADYHISPVFSLNSRLIAGELIGMRASRSFETEIQEGSLNLVLRINQLIGPSWSMNNRFSLYAFGGIGGVRFDASKYVNGSLEKEAEGIVPFIPVGGGMAIRLGQRTDLYIESANRFTNSDDLDAAESAIGKNDVYNFTSVGLVFRLGPRTRGMNWSSRRVVHREEPPVPVAPPTPPEPRPEEVVPEDPPTPTEVIEPEITEPVIELDDKDYFVILGSFQYRGNAERFLMQLQQQGFKPIILRSEAGMFRVSVNAYYNQEDARARVIQIRKAYPEYHDAWMLIRQR